MQVLEPVVAILERAEYNANEVRLVEQLDLKTYTAVNKVLEAAGGKWDKKAKAHIFPSDAYQLLDPVFLTGRIDAVKSAKDEFEFYPTPALLAMDLATKFHTRYGLIGTERILEPSAGHGALIEPWVNQNRSNEGCLKFTLVEKNPAAVAVLQDIYGGLPYVQIIQGDITQITMTGMGFDRIIMNPPFSKQQDIDHILQVLPRLNPGGHLMAIMSASVTFRTNKKTVEFRQLVRDLGGTIEDLPAGSFKEAGTGVNSVVVMF